MGESPTPNTPPCPNCVRLERLIHELPEEVAELRRQLNRNSGNSSLPPSANPPWTPRPVKKKPTGRRPGGQPGHQRHFRKLLPTDQVDHVVQPKPTACEHCAAQFPENTRWEVPGRHQVTELPKPAVEVTEHQAYGCRCEKGGRLTAAPIPQELTRSVLGERRSAAVAFFSSRVHGSRRAVEEVLGAPIAWGTVSHREREMSQSLAEPYRQAKAAVQKAAARNVDETGWKRAGRYLWVAATQRLAVFHLDPCRNRDAMRMLLGKKVRGTICTDRYGVYDEVPLEQRAICWAHLKRDVQPCEKRGGASEPIGREGLRLCKLVTSLWHQFRARQIKRESLPGRLEPVREKIRKLLQRGVRLKAKGTSGFCQDVLDLDPAL